MGILFKEKIIILLFMFLFTCPSLYSLTNYEITQYCKNQKRLKECFQKMKIKKFHLKEGKAIEIPVIPYKE